MMKSDDYVLGKGIEAIFAKTAHLRKGEEKTIELPNGVIRREGDEIIIRLNLGKDDDIRGAIEVLAEAAQSGMLDQLLDPAKVKTQIEDSLQLIDVAIQENELTEAVEENKTILKLNDLPDIHFNLAIVYERLKKSDSAIKHYKIALKSKPNDIECLNNLGRLLYEKGDFTSAMDYYQHILKIEPSFNKKSKGGELFAPKFAFRKISI
jgi:tetratricopeptide (TPR) repeat protein